jgi:DNA repair exonuclease SbcCD ATPase subunit
MNRLLSAEISGFRAFASEQKFDLDADVVILSGPNGSGKTSFFDSILWALSGRLPRFSGRKSQAISLYSPSGTARVALTFQGSDGGNLTVIRTASSEEHSDALVETATGRFEGNTAEVKILETFWPSALQTKDSIAAFCMAFTRSVYLQQDLVREFIESDSEETRFTVMSELLGAGRLNEFLRELERGRNAWSRARTERAKELSEAEGRASQIRMRIERLRELTADEDINKLWSAWWHDAETLGVAESGPALTATEASRSVSDALGVLQAQRRAVERRRGFAHQLLQDWSGRVQGPASDTRLPELMQQQEQLSAQLDAHRKELATAQADAAEERQRLTQRREANEELRSLATLALRHLGETCPVCAQKYPVDATRKRLEQLLTESPAEEQSAIFTRVDELTRQATALEQSLAELTMELAAAERSAAETNAWKDGLAERLKEVGLGAEATPRELDQAVVELSRRAESMADLYSRGEQLALAVAGASEAAQRTELEEQLAAAEQVVDQRRNALAAHEEAGDAATTILDATRAASRELVDSRVRRIEPLVERIYARMDPHPAFTDVSLATSYPGGHGRIRPLVADPSAGLEDRDPYTLFSSSQLNALAVSLFLGLNLGTIEAPLQAVMLDDPLQSLDDVNLLGLVDALRRTKALRQLLVSTHDRRLANLLQRKLRPVGDDGNTRIFSFSDWSEEGPVVEVDEIQAEPAEFRVAAA